MIKKSKHIVFKGFLPLQRCWFVCQQIQNARYLMDLMQKRHLIKSFDCSDVHAKHAHKQSTGSVSIEIPTHLKA